MNNPNSHTQLCLERYVNLGWNIILAHGVKPDPLTGGLMCTCWHGPTCSQPGKHPVYPWKDQPTLTLAELVRRRNLYQYDRTFKEDRHIAQPNWAIVLRRSGLCSIDVDTHPGGANGLESLADLTARFGPLPHTPRDNRGHWLFQLPDEAEANVWPTKIELAPGVELLSGRPDADHLLYCAPSGHRDGTPYRWQDGASPWDLAVATLPTWIIEQANRLAGEQARPQVITAGGNGRANGYYAPADDSAFERARSYLSRIPPAIAGQGGDNRTFYAACRVVVDFGVDFGQALNLLREWNATCSPPWKDRDLDRFVKSAMSRPGPRGRLRDRSRDVLDREFAHLRNVLLTIVRPCRRKHGEHVPCMCPKCGPAAGAAGSDGAFASADPYAGIGDPRNDSVIDEIRRDEQMKAEEQRVAQENYRAQFRRFVCEKTYGLLMYDFLKDSEFIMRLRCNNWSCSGCRNLFKYQWSNNVNLRFKQLQTANPEALVYVARTTRDEWESALRRRCNRGGGEAFTFSADSGRTLIVYCTVDIFHGRCERLLPTAAADRLTRTIEEFDGSRCPLTATADWRLPKRAEESKDRCECIGQLDASATPERVEAAAEAIGVVITSSSGRAESKITGTFGIKYPALWTPYQRQWFRDLLVFGMATDGTDIERVVGPPPPEPQEVYLGSDDERAVTDELDLELAV
jgi:hypothetical protein